mmetsp:Transcript_5436/g.7868  ORF Transcript_5436/g.7868 Transcript_5436/m.7868 type:complete len:144 (-) Transcript_5436:265-696(-)
MKRTISAFVIILLCCTFKCRSFEQVPTWQKKLVVPYPRQQHTSDIETRHHLMSKGNNNDEDDDKINNFLDKPFFDAEEYDEDDDSFLGRFANLVKYDYQTAEFLYVAAVFIFLLVATQEFLRMQMYGDGYIPFASGRGSGKLF